MDYKPDFCTKTMAKLYASQGYYQNTIDICKYLIDHKEKDDEILILLTETKKKATNQDKTKKDKTKKDKLHNLFDNWIDLILEYNKLKKLQTFHKNFTE